MIGAIWILLFTVAVGIILYLFELRWRSKNKNNKSLTADAAGDSPLEAGEREEDSQCCGLHLVCEKDSLSPMSDTILYYDDEELDRFIGRDADSYSPEETEEFRDVLMTLLPADVAGWARSITQRHIQLPPEVRDELLILVREQRDSERETGQN